MAEKPKAGYLDQTFEAAAYQPAANWTAADRARLHMTDLPWCKHCGNPQDWHDADGYCPDRKLHPALPAPSCDCHRVKQQIEPVP